LSNAGVTGSAGARVAARAARFRAAGLWATEPVDLVADAAAQYPEHRALVSRDRALTYRDLDAAVHGAARYLRARGVRPGDPVLLLVGNDITSVIALHASLRAGAVTMVAPTSAGAAQVGDIVAMAPPRLALAPATWIAATPEVTGDAANWCAIAEVSDAPPLPDAPGSARDPDDPGIVIFTSGTTSKPKGVVHSWNTLLVATRNYVDAARLTADDRLFIISPLASVTGILQVITVAPLIGATAVLEDKFDNAATFDLLMETGGTFFGGPDLLLDRVLDEAASRGIDDVPLRSVFLGGSMLDARILDRAEQDYGIVVLRAYGSSEAPLSTSGTQGETRGVRLGDDGVPLAGVEVRIGSAADPAECCIGGAHLFLGYVDPDDDVAAFDGDWFCTGDLAELRDGRLKVFGRIKDIVIRNGLKIPVSEVDGMVAALPGVAQCAGYGVADPTTGERLAMAVRPSAGATVSFDDMVAGLVLAGAAKWKIPEELVLWDEDFPATASGKVVRSQLDEKSAGRPRTVAARLR
jgi:acyl-CoA synthetase (AMP-forming)/AMP-acid ligase II